MALLWVYSRSDSASILDLLDLKLSRLREPAAAGSGEEYYACEVFSYFHKGPQCSSVTCGFPNKTDPNAWIFNTML
jgi:hypothetical protein